MGELRPELHRYCARLTSSVFDGEDIVQDTLARALVALPSLETPPILQPWLFRIAHNRALDFLRSRAIRSAEPLEAAEHVVDDQASDPVEILMRHEAVNTAISRFVELPTVQRSVVVLKDVLGHSLEEIAGLLDMTVGAVKATLHRGRARLHAINANSMPIPITRRPSTEVALYVALFNQRDWEGLRALLADDVKLNQTTHPPRIGAADVGMFFTVYARSEAVYLVPALLEGREIAAVFQSEGDTKPSYMMQLDWRDGQIVSIRDFRYVRYVVEDAEIVLASAPPA